MSEGQMIPFAHGKRIALRLHSRPRLDGVLALIPAPPPAVIESVNRECIASLRYWNVRAQRDGVWVSRDVVHNDQRYWIVSSRCRVNAQNRAEVVQTAFSEQERYEIAHTKPDHFAKFLQMFFVGSIGSLVFLAASHH